MRLRFLTRSIYTSPHRTPRLPPPSSTFHYHFPPNTPVPNSPAYIDALDGTQISHTQVKNQALSLGWTVRQIKQQGNAKDGPTTVLLFATNSVHYSIVFFAAQAARMVVSLASSSYTPSELAYHIHDSRPALAFVEEALMDVYEQACREVKQPPRAVYSMPGAGTSTTTATTAAAAPKTAVTSFKSTAQAPCYTTLMAESASLNGWQGDPIGPNEEHETAVLCYSSGTVSEIFSSHLTGHYSSDPLVSLDRSPQGCGNYALELDHDADHLHYGHAPIVPRDQRPCTRPVTIQSHFWSRPCPPPSTHPTSAHHHLAQVHPPHLFHRDSAVPHHMVIHRPPTRQLTGTLFISWQMGLVEPSWHVEWGSSHVLSRCRKGHGPYREYHTAGRVYDHSGVRSHRDISGDAFLAAGRCET